MKLKTLMTCLLALLLAVPGADMSAQTRKKTGGARKTTTTRKTRSTTTTAQNKLVGHNFIGVLKLPEMASVLGSDVGLYSYLSLNEGGKMDLTVIKNELEGTWSLSGSKLSMVTGQIKGSFTSSSNGNVLRGSLILDKSKVWKMDFYKIKKGAFTMESLKQSFVKKTLRAIVDITSPNGRNEVLFPVDIQLEPNEDGTGGTYKFTADNSMGLGLVKGTYTFTETGMKITSNLPDCRSKEFGINSNKDELICPQIGTVHVDDWGNSNVYLFLFNQ